MGMLLSGVPCETELTQAQKHRKRWLNIPDGRNILNRMKRVVWTSGMLGSILLLLKIFYLKVSRIWLQDTRISTASFSMLCKFNGNSRSSLFFYYLLCKSRVIPEVSFFLHLLILEPILLTSWPQVGFSLYVCSPLTIFYFICIKVRQKKQCSSTCLQKSLFLCFLENNPLALVTEFKFDLTLTRPCRPIKTERVI